MDVDVAENPDNEEALAQIPDNLRFDLAERPERDTVPFALGDTILTASRPKEFTMLSLAAAMSHYADGPDAAYAIMMFCTDAFDGPTRNRVAQLYPEDMHELIRSLCEHWGQDTSVWGKRGNRADRRAKGARKRR